MAQGPMKKKTASSTPTEAKVPGPMPQKTSHVKKKGRNKSGPGA